MSLGPHIQWDAANKLNTLGFANSEKWDCNVFAQEDFPGGFSIALQWGLKKGSTLLFLFLLGSKSAKKGKTSSEII